MPAGRDCALAGLSLMARFGWLMPKAKAAPTAQPWPETHPFMETLRIDVQPEALTKEDIGAMAQDIDVPRANMLAVIRQESSNSGFTHHSDGFWRPKIRLELHKLNEYTDGMYADEHPDLFKRRWNIRDANVDQETHYKRMNDAMLVMEGMHGIEPALSAASWGMGQILGVNFRLTGSGTIDRFCGRMAMNEREQVKAMITFIDSHPPMRRALANRDWYTFAMHYNGRGRAQRYSQELAHNFYIVTGRRA